MSLPLTPSKGVLRTSPSPKGRGERYAGISATSPLSFSQRDSFGAGEGEGGEVIIFSIYQLFNNFC